MSEQVSCNILIVEDDDRMRELLNDYLERENYRVIEAADGRQALKVFDQARPDLVILDLMLPGLNGWEVCSSIRHSSQVPIIMLTARSEDDDKLKGFDLGADDYITKPCSPGVLVAHVKALLKRTGAKLPDYKEYIHIDQLIINRLTHEVTSNGQIIYLSPREYDLLVHLILNRDRVISREELLEKLWGYSYYGNLRTVDTHINRLRDKLGVNSYLVTTIRGHGYTINPRSK
ncbi:MAG: response regulator transcription factor [Methylocystaceae bacterium]